MKVYVVYNKYARSYGDAWDVCTIGVFSNVESARKAMRDDIGTELDNSLYQEHEYEVCVDEPDRYEVQISDYEHWDEWWIYEFEVRD